MRWDGAAWCVRLYWCFNSFYDDNDSNIEFKEFFKVNWTIDNMNGLMIFCIYDNVYTFKQIFKADFNVIYSFSMGIQREQ